MQRETKSLIWGIILIVIGFLFLGHNLDWFYLEWGNLWPLFLIAGGVLFWSGWMMNRHEYGLLMPGTVLLTYGLMFFYCTTNGWEWMEQLWPVFLLGPGLGFFFMYLLGNQEKGLLIPASILTVLALLFWSGHDVFRFFWPIALIVVGVFLLINTRKSQPVSPEQPDLENGDSKQNA